MWDETTEFILLGVDMSSTREASITAKKKTLIFKTEMIMK